MVDVPKVGRTLNIARENTNAQQRQQQDHLVCFLGGSFMLGATVEQSISPPDPSTFTAAQSDDFYIGQALIKTCVSLYTSTKTGLAPEIAMFFMKGEEAMMKNDRSGRDWWIKRQGRAIGVDPPIDARNILRPETVESLFLAYRITGDPIYRFVLRFCVSNWLLMMIPAQRMGLADLPSVREALQDTYRRIRLDQGRRSSSRRVR